MSAYITADDVEVDAVLLTADETASNPTVDGDVWEITFPSGEIRYCHPSAFDANYTEV